MNGWPLLYRFVEAVHRRCDDTSILMPTRERVHGG